MSEKAIVNGIPGRIVQRTEPLPNVGLGPATAIIGYEFIPDPQPPVAPNYRFDRSGRITLAGKPRMTYRVWQRIGDSWIYQTTIHVPPRTKAADLKNYLHGADE